MKKHEFHQWFAGLSLDKRHTILAPSWLSPHEIYFALKEAEDKKFKAKMEIEHWVEIIGKIDLNENKKDDRLGSSK